jgi:hypothetical protein
MSRSVIVSFALLVCFAPLSGAANSPAVAPVKNRAPVAEGAFYCLPLGAVPGFNDSVSVERGPLVNALGIREHWRKLKRSGPVTDWEVFPSSPWNYGSSEEFVGRFRLGQLAK